MIALREILEAAARGARLPLKELTVQDHKLDPYRQDTEAGHTRGEWVADQLVRIGRDRPIHIRGLHYALMSSGAVKPSGEPYRNTEEDWEWLQDEACKAARWLGYIPFEMIVDAKNAPPVIKVYEEEELQVAVGPRTHSELHIPVAWDLEPSIALTGFNARQKYRLAIYGEKDLARGSSRPDLRPLPR
jgi:hypothetical protein